jgi:uncharacterized protein
LTRNFPWWRRASEYLQYRLFQDAWPAKLGRLIWPPAFRVWQERLQLTKPLGTAPRLRLAFASDFHAGPLTPPETIHTACSAILAASPDLIVLGGDFVSLASRHARRLLEPLGSLHAPLGVVAVLGNHDHWAGAEIVGAVLEEAGVTLLTNRSHRFPAPFENTLVVGLDDHLSGYPDAATPTWDPAAVTILAIHQPSGLLDAGDRHFDVVLAGHTHGGQILLPGGFAPVVPEGRYSRCYLAGRYTLAGGGQLMVSVGIGNSGLPIRLGPTPEILICDLHGGPGSG